MLLDAIVIFFTVVNQMHESIGFNSLNIGQTFWKNTLHVYFVCYIELLVLKQLEVLVFKLCLAFLH